MGRRSAFAFLLRIFCATAFALPIYMAPASAQSSTAEDQIIKQNLGSETPADVYRRIEEQEARRAREAEERQRLETEVRTTVSRIRKQLFDLELFFAKMRDGIVPVDCSRLQALQAQAEEMRALASDFEIRCASLPENAVESRALCQNRIAETRKELAALESQHSGLAASCGGEGQQ